ncbi:hypothetical protein [Chryseobacterium sp. SIMBA_028]|uniref:hypothetical protein n=1 Tax=Chryseobacterium sp. SIMBA_028 TaxID=3085771 RepID=UPI003978CB0C
MADLLDFEISIASLNSRIEALKASLNSGQKVIFDNKIKELKEKFILEHPGLTEEHLKTITQKFR